MLNFPTADPEDKVLLQNSYNALLYKNSMEIASDPVEVDEVLKRAMNLLTFPDNCQVLIVNLFRYKAESIDFYIAQMLYDFRYHYKGRGVTLEDKYNFQIIGIGRLNKDFGKIAIRPEVKVDGLIGRFFKSDIQFPDNSYFNQKYYTVADRKENAFALFDRSALDAIASVKGVHIKIDKQDMLVMFDESMQAEQSRSIEKIFLSMR
jgi:hypothetical protein